ncbi:hypothetical protein LguiB_022065 [Lonicera macranthoides]
MCICRLPPLCQPLYRKNTEAEPNHNNDNNNGPDRPQEILKLGQIIIIRRRTGLTAPENKSNIITM